MMNWLKDTGWLVILLTAITLMLLMAVSTMHDELERAQAQVRVLQSTPAHCECNLPDKITIDVQDVEVAEPVRCELWDVVNNAVESQLPVIHTVGPEPTLAAEYAPPESDDQLSRMVKAIGRKVVAMERQHANTWHASYIDAFDASRKSLRPIVVIVGVDGCEACDELATTLQKRTWLPYEFAYLKHDSPSRNGETVAETFGLRANTTYPTVIGVWGNFQVPLTEEFFR